MSIEALPPPPRGDVPDRLRRVGSVAWSMVGLAAVLALFGLVMWTFRVVLPPLVLAAAIVFVLNPAVTRLANRGLHRAVATALTYLAVLAALALLTISVLPLATDQAAELGDDWPQIQSRAERWLDDRAADSQGTFWEFSRQELEESFSGGERNLSDQLDQARRIGLQLFHFLLVLILGPILAFYLLVDLPHLGKVTRSLVPRRAREEFEVVTHRLGRAIGGFFRGQLVVALVVGVMVSIGLAIIGLRFWFLIGMIAGIFNMIPLIGPWIGGIPGLIIALTTGDVVQAIGVVVVMVVAQQIDNHFITPYVMQRAVSLHPAAVVLALLAGGSVGGFFGLLMAVPVAACLKILIGHLWRTYVLGQPLEEEVAVQAIDDAGPKDGIVEDVLDERPPVGLPDSHAEVGSQTGAVEGHREDGA